MAALRISERHQDGRAIFSLAGDLDFDNCPVLLLRLTLLTRSEPAPTVELDLADVEEVDAAGIALLRSLADQLRVRGGCLLLGRDVGLLEQDLACFHL